MFILLPLLMITLQTSLAMDFFPKTCWSVVLRPTSLPPWLCWNSPKSWTSRTPLLSSPKVLPPYVQMFKSTVWFKVIPGIWWLGFGGHHTKLESLGCLLWENHRWNEILLKLNMFLPLPITCIQTLGLMTLRPTFALSQPELTTEQPDLNQQ